MDIEAYKEAIANADVAFANARFENAVAWYDKALKEAPDDGYALSKAGTALVSLNRFDDAFVYFNRAVESDPQNGDHVFNLANAYFFAGDIPKAMENYTAAEMMECSDDVRARIYYQLALMCSIKRDYKAALINYQKYEDADKTGQVSLDTDVLSERVQLYLQVEDFDNALKYTLKWLNLAPDDLRCYVVYFNLLTVSGQYGKALKVLDDAEKFAAKDENDKYALDVSRANLYVNAANTEFDTGRDFNQKAYDLMNELIVSPYGTQDSKNELVLALGELCISMEKVDEAIDLMTMLTAEAEPEEEPAAPVQPADTSVDPAEIDAMLAENMQAMEAKIASGEINALQKEDAEQKAAEQADFRARVNYTLLTCYAFKEDFEKTIEYARLVRMTPNNTYYSYFGRYSEAFAMMRLAKMGREGYTLEDAKRKYDEELAFFRGEMIKANESSAFALLFRTRMYAELGKYGKAEELAGLMTDQDRAALMSYIEECRKQEAD